MYKIKIKVYTFKIFKFFAYRLLIKQHNLYLIHYNCIFVPMLIYYNIINISIYINVVIYNNRTINYGKTCLKSFKSILYK